MSRVIENTLRGLLGSGFSVCISCAGAPVVCSVHICRGNRRDIGIYTQVLLVRLVGAVSSDRGWGRWGVGEITVILQTTGLL